jgi:hypothetical protein
VEFSEKRPPRPPLTLAWAKQALTGRIAVPSGRPTGLLGYTAGSLNGSPEEVFEIRVQYPDVTVATLRHPAVNRPDATPEELIADVMSQVEQPPDDITGDTIEAWLASQRSRPGPVVEPSPEPLVIADEPYACVRMLPRDGMSARLAVLDGEGLAVIVAGHTADVTAVALTWA